LDNSYYSLIGHFLINFIGQKLINIIGHSLLEFNWTIFLDISKMHIAKPAILAQQNQQYWHNKTSNLIIAKPAI